jgi:Heavy-metal resistance protein CzcE
MKHFPSLTHLVGLGLAGALSLAHAQSADFRFGSAIDAAQAERSITIAADTRWANVTQGESIRFVSGANVFGWKFDGTHSAVDLSKLAPAGFVERPLMVYIKREYRGPGSN